ncbi:MAG: hypothetical protein ABFD62_14815 [Syntrophaceae bacterium]
MKWIEVIKISAAENRRTALENKIRSVMWNLKTEGNPQMVKLYRNLPDGDLSIHLFWDEGKAEPWGSKTGLCLARLLKQYGLISHSVWVENKSEEAFGKALWHEGQGTSPGSFPRNETENLELKGVEKWNR